MGRADDSIGYDPNNSVFDNDQGGHYNNVPNPMMNNANSSNPNNPVVMMQMTTPVPQLSGQGDVNYNTGAPRAAFEDDEHQRQIRLMHQGIGEQPPVMQRPKSSMSGQQSRGLFLFYFVVLLPNYFGLVNSRLFPRLNISDPYKRFINLCISFLQGYQESIGEILTFTKLSSSFKILIALLKQMRQHTFSIYAIWMTQ